MTPSQENQQTCWVTSVTIDCHDPESLASFWSQLLGLEVCPRHGRYVALARPPTLTPELVFQPVPEPKQGKARMHLDIGVHDLEESRRLAFELGATAADDLESDDPELHVLRDPEGNEFCLVYKPSDTKQA
jgi:catechol-2,3-dioxygenase